MLDDMVNADEAKRILAAGMPLPRAMTAFLPEEERHAAKLLAELGKVGGDVAKMSTIDQANYAILRDRGVIKALTGDEESPQEKIARGLMEAEAARDDAASEAFKVLEDLATKALKARRKADWSDFRSKRAAQAVTKNLAAEFEKLELTFNQDHLSKVSSECRELANAHLAELKKAFGEVFKPME